MKYCPKCGTELTEDVKFCTKCGNQVAGEENVNNYTTDNVNHSCNNNVNITRREIAIAVILSIVTCGIYGIYWFIVMTDDVNRVSGDNKTSGALAFVFSLLTCGIYTIYWNYKMGKQLYEAGLRSGKNISDNSILYLVLSLFGLSIVNYCLIQNDLNQFAN